MLEVLSGFDGLANRFQSTEARLVVSFVAAATLLFVLLSYRDIEDRLHAKVRPLYADIVLTVVTIVTGVLAVLVILGVWGQTTEVRQLYTELGLGVEVVANGIFSVTVLVITYILSRFVTRVIEELLHSSTAVSDHEQEVTRRLSQVLIWSVSAVVILSVWVDDLSGLLIGAGVLGIVIGMAARQTLGTILSGFVLMFARPFEIGDWVEVEDREGIVTDISIVNTRIRSFDGEYVMVPNDLIASNMVTNRSKRGRLRIEIEIGVDYDTDVERASELAKDAVAKVDESLDVPEPGSVTKAFGDSAIIIGVRFWVSNPSSRRRWKARTAAIREIKRSFDEAGVKIPFPQRELSDRTETGGFAPSSDSYPVSDTARGRERPSDDSRRGGDADSQSDDDGRPTKPEESQ